MACRCRLPRSSSATLSTCGSGEHIRVHAINGLYDLIGDLLYLHRTASIHVSRNEVDPIRRQEDHTQIGNDGDGILRLGPNPVDQWLELKGSVCSSNEVNAPLAEHQKHVVVGVKACDLA